MDYKGSLNELMNAFHYEPETIRSVSVPFPN